MTLTPQDVESQVFKERFRGYDPVEVDRFLDQVSESLATLARERDTARGEAEQARRVAEESAATRERDEGSGVSEDLLRRTLLSAERTAEQTVGEARAEAEQLRAEARAEAEELLEEARREAEELRERTQRDTREQREAARAAAEEVRQAIVELRTFRSDYHDRVEAVVSEQLAALERMELPEIPETIDRLGGLGVGDGDEPSRGHGGPSTGDDEPADDGDARPPHPFEQQGGA